MDACEIANFLASELFMQQVKRQTDDITNKHMSPLIYPPRSIATPSISTQMKSEVIVDHTAPPDLTVRVHRYK